MLPWPSRLHMTTVLSISSTDMQSLARSRSLPTLFFNPSSLPNPDGSIPSEPSNESVFRSLCRSLESKNLSAFLSHGPKSGTGIALIPFKIPQTSLQNPNGVLRLIGIVFNEPINFPTPGGGNTMGGIPQQISGNGNTNANRNQNVNQEQGQGNVQQNSNLNGQQPSGWESFAQNSQSNSNPNPSNTNYNAQFQGIDMAQLQLMMQQTQSQQTQNGGGQYR